MYTVLLDCGYIAEGYVVSSGIMIITHLPSQAINLNSLPAARKIVKGLPSRWQNHVVAICKLSFDSGCWEVIDYYE